jgi:hypothetical protein
VSSLSPYVVCLAACCVLGAATVVLGAVLLAHGVGSRAGFQRGKKRGYDEGYRRAFHDMPEARNGFVAEAAKMVSVLETEAQGLKSREAACAAKEKSLKEIN